MKAKSDPDVEHLLRERDLRFRYCDDGDFRLSFGTYNGRSHQLFISSKICELDGMKLRKVYAVAYRGRITKPMAMELLRENYKLGYWHIDEDAPANREVVMFMAQIPWDIMPADFETALRRIAEAADRKEDEWSDVDEL